MADTLESLLEAIAAEQRRWGEPVDPPASGLTLVEAEIFLRDRYSIAVPQVLSSLWRIRDGVYFNGMMLYRASDDDRTPYRRNLREANNAAENIFEARYLHIGESDMDAFLFDRADGGWHMADKVSLDSFEYFESSEALVLTVLRKYLAA